MSYLSGLAQRLGTAPTAIDRFVSTGEAVPGIAHALRVSTHHVHEFVTGRVPGTIAALLGLTVQNAQQLRDVLSRDAAIGMLLGIACAQAPGQPHEVSPVEALLDE